MTSFLRVFLPKSLWIFLLSCVTHRQGTYPIWPHQRNIWRWVQILKRPILRYLLGPNVLPSPLLRVGLSNLGERRSKWSKFKKSCFKMCFTQNTFISTQNAIRIMYSHAWESFLNILNKGHENFDLKLLEFMTLSRMLSSLRTLKLWQNNYFYDSLMTTKW